MFKSLSKKTQIFIKPIKTNDLVFSILIALIMIAVGLSFGWYNNKVVPINPDPIAHYIPNNKNPLSFTSNWDGPNYLSIAKFSYTNSGQTNFFPLYPLLIKIVHYIIPSFLISALLISWAALVGAIYFFIRIIKLLYKEKSSIATLPYLLFLVLFPTAVFFIGTYTESLMAMLSLGAIYFALQKKYELSAILSLFAVLTNLDGLLVLFFVVLILLEQRLSLIKTFIFGVFSLLGLATYSYYLFVRFNNALLFISSQKAHGWLNHNYSELISGIDPFNLIFIIVLIVGAIYWIKQRRISFALYSLSFLLIPAIGNQFGGFNRYVLMAFPIQIMVYPMLKKHPSIFIGVVIFMTISWSYFMFQYFGGYVGG